MPSYTRLITPTHLAHVLEQIHDTSKILLATGDDLVWRQDKAVSTCVTELHGENVVTFDYIIDIVDTASSSLVDGRADRAVVEAHTVDVVDGVDGAFGKGLEFTVVGGNSTAGVAVG